jgi:hypothetical protein
MKLVDLTTWARPVAQIYSAIPQPMTVYHSTDEFESNVQNATRIETFGELMDFVFKNKISLVYTTDNRYVDVRKYNVWVKSIDGFIPDFADDFGNIYYAKDAEGQPIPTDGCWVELFFITPTPAKLVLFTSAGLNTAGITKWTVTGAIRPTFIQESVPDKRQGSNSYEAKLAKLISRRKPDVKFTKLALALLSSDSESFLDVNKAVSITFGHTVRAADREKIIESQAFREAVMSVIKTLFPSLAPAIRKEHNPEKLSGMLATIWNIAENSKDIDKMLKVFDKITQVGYEENTAISDSRLPVPGLISDGKQTAREISFPDPFQLSQNEAKDEDAGSEKDEEEIETLKEDLDYPQSFIMQDEEESEKE